MQRGQLGAQPVVQVPPQAATFLLAGGDQPLARALQFRGQAHGVNSHARLSRQVAQQTPVGG